MDPCETFPLEILEMLWSALEEKDLLSCRLVSPAWRALLDDSPVWRRWTLSRGKVWSSPWEDYLELGKRAAAWTSGRFTLSRLGPGRTVHEAKIFIGSEYVYIMKERTIYFYDMLLGEVLHEHTVCEGKTIVMIRCWGRTLAILVRDRAYKYQLEVVEGRESVATVEVSGRAFCVGRSGEVLYTAGGWLWERRADGRSSRAEAPPGVVDELAETDHFLAALSAHPVRLGAGFTVYRRERAEGAAWTAVYCAESRSPLAVLRGSLSASDQCLLVREVSGSEHWTTTRHLLLRGPGCRAELDADSCWLAGDSLVLRTGRALLHCELPLAEDLPPPVAVHGRSPAEIVVVCADGSLHYFRQGRRLYSALLGVPLLGAKFAGDNVLLWGPDVIYTLTLKEVDRETACFSDLIVLPGDPPQGSVLV